ncbi:transcriptional regulator, GntR family [Cupriavidus sp. OV038]|jgi:DNA-binding FadR family transcriptional regulator|uniref:FadR/GntR family transcriptional regulator n=1 Tax=unclassified Cupriavidus TaxID=2640874 RepID=UPI0008DF5603|nr:MULTISPECIES: FCD domain-containing protein [unclassified Cupriavidus]SFD37741.1 transcriptional regulator, GntR family [Cupriavidus sp. OV038]SFQ07963.1 transcriptional regulator, GntR family [Cupriavidus sp. OV096]
MQTTRPITLTERVIQQLRAEIADGVYPVGARLPTGKQLAEQYGVSTAVIREVTEHLRSQGMIESRQGLGSTVRSRVSDAGFRLSGQAGADAADLAAIYELRLDLESAAAAMAARRRTDDDLRRMADLLGTLAAQLHDIDRGAESDTQFHVAVATATHNKYYQDLLQYLNLQLHHAVRTARGNSQQQPGLPEQVHGEHVAIFEAIRAADPEAARLAAAAHLRNAAARLGLPLRAAA